MFREILSMGIDSLRADKLRAAMTALGMAVGTTALILVVTISLYRKTLCADPDRECRHQRNLGRIFWSFQRRIERGRGRLSHRQGHGGGQQQVPGIQAASPVLNMHQRIAVEGGKEREILILGVDPDYQRVRRIIVSAGRFFDQQDSQSGNKVALITESMAKLQFGGLDQALGQTIKIQEVPFVIIGTFRESVDTFGRSEIEDNTVLIPYSVAQALTGTTAVNQIYFSMSDAASIPAATDSIHSVIAARHRPESVYNVSNLTEVLRLANKTATAFTSVLLLFTAVTLVAAGVGIMNIMLATVHSRIHEIGVRKAVGATRRAILLQFLFEAVLIALLGGSVGMVVGLGIPISIAIITNHYIPVSPASAIVAVLVSCAVGVAFGITPANNAAKLDPVECLRHE